MGTNLLQEMVGNKLSADLKLNSTPQKQLLSIKANSPRLTLDGDFTLDGKTLKLQGKEAQVKWTLTPEAYRALDQRYSGDQKNPFELKKEATVNLSFSSLYLPMQTKEGPPYPLNRF